MISFSDSTAKYIQIANRLRQAIRNGKISENSKISSERNLADMYSVSYMTVRQAIAELEKEGLVRREQGRGTFVNPFKKGKDKTFNIGIFVHNTDHLFNPYTEKLVKAIARKAEEKNHSIRIFTSNQKSPVNGPKRLLGIIPQDEIDALIATIIEINEKYLYDLQKANIPLVVVNGNFPGEQIPVIAPPHLKGRLLALEYIISKGHTNICCIFIKPFSKILAAYKNFMFEKGISSSNLHVLEIDRHSVKNGYQAMKRILSHNTAHRITAVLAGDDLVAKGAVKAALEEGLSIPEDIAVMGYNGSLEMENPSLSTVKIDSSKMGTIAAEMAFNLIGGRKITNPRVTIEPELIRGESA